MSNDHHPLNTEKMLPQHINSCLLFSLLKRILRIPNSHLFERVFRNDSDITGLTRSPTKITKVGHSLKGTEFGKLAHGVLYGYWLVVSTHSKSSPIFGVKITRIYTHPRSLPAKAPKKFPSK